MLRHDVAVLLALALAEVRGVGGNDPHVISPDKAWADARERGIAADRARREQREAEYRAVADQLQAERRACKEAAFAKRQPKA